MKRKILIMICLVFLSINAFAKKGPQIPMPKILATAAIALATDYFTSEKTQIVDGHYFKKDDYILISINYTNKFKDNEWAWKIVFVHPKQNDHSATFKVVNQKVITLLSVTE